MRTVVDFEGTEVEVPETVERIVVVGPLPLPTVLVACHGGEGHDWSAVAAVANQTLQSGGIRGRKALPPWDIHLSSNMSRTKFPAFLWWRKKT
jgi:ABC-type Fe3+-hydroxamate transport system substrate-binding protein